MCEPAFSAPAKAGEGDHAKRGGGGVSFNVSLSFPNDRRGPRPFHHPALASRASDGPPSPLSRGRKEYVTFLLTYVTISVTKGRISLSNGRRRRRPVDRARCMVERREAPRARSRRFAQADRSVARATPEARAGGNIRPRGVATTLGASRRSIPPVFGGTFVKLEAKLGRERAARTNCVGRARWVSIEVAGESNAPRSW